MVKSAKPRSKILILDAKENFSKQPLFQDGWQKFYAGMIEWVPVGKDGKVKVRVSGEVEVADLQKIVTQALASAPPPYSYVEAAATAAAGAVEIAAIASTNGRDQCAECNATNPSRPDRIRSTTRSAVAVSIRG